MNQAINPIYNQGPMMYVPKAAPINIPRVAPIAPVYNPLLENIPRVAPIAPVYNPPLENIPKVAPIRQATATPFRVMCFSWNASGLRLCESMSQIRANEYRNRTFTRRPPCIAPDFFEVIRSSVKSRQPELVVMTTQDEDSSGTYFHAELLPNILPEINYSLLKRNVMSGIGETASGVQQLQSSGSALRISVYARNDIMPLLKTEEITLNSFFNDEGQVQSTCKQEDRTSGAIASYVWHPVYGKFAFIAVHIPAGMNALQVGQELDYLSYRTASKASNILCLLKIYNQLVASLPEESRPDHVFLLGDMNYNIVIPGKSNEAIINELAANVTAAKLKELQRYDEMRRAVYDYPLTDFKEGVAGEGPLFLPTWNLTRGRKEDCVPDKTTVSIDPSCFTESNIGSIGWHDRILYKELLTSKYITHCIDYSRLDFGNMHESTHAGVTAVFELRE